MDELKLSASTVQTRACVRKRPGWVLKHVACWSYLLCVLENTLQHQNAQLNFDTYHWVNVPYGTSGSDL